MPVISTRRYSSSSYLPSTSTSSSSLGVDRARNSSLSSSTSDESSYRSLYRSSLSSTKNYGTSTTSSSFRSSRFDDYDKNKTPISTSLSSRIGVSKTNSRLPPLPPTASSSLSMSDMDFYEKYSPSRYSTKYELSRARSVSDSTQMTTRDKQSPSSIKSIGSDSPSYTSKSEIRSVTLRNALPTTSSRTWDRDYTSSYSSRNSLSDSRTSNDKGESRNGLTSYAAGGYRSSNISPSKASPGRDSVYDRKSSSTVEGQCGIFNIGNSCYLNSILQCLSHTMDLSKFVRSSSASSATIEASTSKDKKVWTEFCKLIQQMWQPATKSVSPSDLKMALSNKYRMYSGSAQQDAQEFLRYLLDTMHGALNSGGQKISLHIDDDMSDLEKANEMWDWYTKRENSMVKDLFVGQLKSSLFCTFCEKTSVMYDPFWDLSLPVPSTPNCKLDKCLEMFTVKDVLDGNPYCDYCKTSRKCIKGFTIQRFPKYLVIHLKRFSEMRWTKLTTIVDFPTGVAELDLTPYASESMEKSDPQPIYSLYGISNHMGSTHGGHYVAICKHPVTKKWFEFNDNFVSETRESSLVSSSAYLLFYERV